MDGKRVGVLFSGGLDSTYLVWKNLSEGNEVVPIYIEIQNNENKSNLEKNRVECLHKEFRTEFKDNIKSVVWGMSAHVTPDTNIFLKQVPLWITGLLYNQNHGVDELQIGYVMGDDAISYLEDIQSVYKVFNKLNDCPLKKLVFPLKKNNKYDMGHDLPQQYKNFIVSCEAPDNEKEVDSDGILQYTPCGICVPCGKIMHSDNFGMGLSKKYRDNLVKTSFDYIIRHTTEETETKFS